MHCTCTPIMAARSEYCAWCVEMARRAGALLPLRGVTPRLPVPRPYIPPATLPDDMLELLFMEEIRKLAHTEGWKTYHTYGSKKSEEDWPDLALLRESFLLVELKTNTQKPSIGQTVWLYLLEYAGVESFLWRPRDWPEIVARLTRHEA